MASGPATAPGEYQDHKYKGTRLGSGVGSTSVGGCERLRGLKLMDLWMYLVIIAMFLLATAGTVWITLWTIQRGERAKAEREQRAEGTGNREQGTVGDGERGG